jgi:hypothetical protein
MLYASALGVVVKFSSLLSSSSPDGLECFSVAKSLAALFSASFTGGAALKNLRRFLVSFFSGLAAGAICSLDEQDGRQATVTATAIKHATTVRFLSDIT